MSLEQFRPIEGYENYLVSTWGKVYRVDRAAQILSRGKNSYQVSTRKLTELATEETPKGYLRVYLYRNGKRKHHKIHRLVAKAFIPNPQNKPQVNHKDGNKKNNSITNLEWVTDEENKLHRELLTVRTPHTNKPSFYYKEGECRCVSFAKETKELVGNITDKEYYQREQ